MSTSAFAAPARDDGPRDDRLPPQDVGAEQSVLGGMLLSKDAIADCVEVLKGTDFYRPAHEVVYDAVLDLYGRGEPADAITVADELTKRGDLTRVGGQAYLHQLIASVPTAANAGYYAQIVAERAVLRRLVEAGTRIVQLGYAQGGGDVEDIVNAAQAEVYSVSDTRGGEDYHSIGELIEATVDEIEVATGRSGEMTGVPTGFTDLDSLTNGLHPGQMIVLAARPAMGKALALDTPLPSPGGWTTMGSVAVGDLVLGSEGHPTRVLAATEVMHGRPCCRVELSDGSVIVADEQHQWAVSLDGGPTRVVTSAEAGYAAERGRVVTIERVPGQGGIRMGVAQWKIERIVPCETVPVRCIEVAAEDHLYLAGESMVPTHNSTLGLDVARTAAIKHKLASVVFSLEMSRTEITMRMLSAEAGIQLQHMRKGTMREEDWTRLASTMARVSDAPLFIDDSPNMSLMEIRAKCRRLKQRSNLKLVIIDYLQLMSSGKRVESRQQEVSEFSRALKLLAKELEVPVIAISQLNRGPEQRTDKKPQMSDLRESGCLTADTRILRADTGAEMSIRELLDEFRRHPDTEVPVWGLDDSLRHVIRPMTTVFATGVRPVFRLTLASGKQVRATENHPFLTVAGWVSLGELCTGDKVAVPRHVPAPEQFAEVLDDRDLRTGALILSSRTKDRPGWRVEGLGCSIGFDVAPMAQRCLMPDIASFPKRQIGLLIDALWALDGEVSVDEGAREGRIVLRHASRRLLEDVARLLLRFGISTVVRGAGGTWSLDVVGVDDQRRFLQEIAIHSERSAAAESLLRIVRARSGLEASSVAAVTDDRARVTVRPEDLADEMVADEAGLDLERIEELFDSLELDLEAANDVLWDEVVTIEPDGVEQVYDATVLGTHNFIANGIAVHNSIEQDADMVILLHREAAYEKDSPREGEADLIVAKHRNGPTDTITVAFQGHYSRFTNMASNF
ncbi:MAG: replicative DNA helicase [Intrasporangium sp.]|uniref:replicative DNA helicase n=1 Tax=Intrasporangium sp. TaxID=1925024 RepID=UPI002649B9A5|nr:replicative DNA helicase [Intrasporangium sp.]MDN5795841.1 replicative DNA helicase [Intrasporangium sp.]